MDNEPTRAFAGVDRSELGRAAVDVDEVVAIQLRLPRQHAAEALLLAWIEPHATRIRTDEFGEPGPPFGCWDEVLPWLAWTELEGGAWLTDEVGVRRQKLLQEIEDRCAELRQLTGHRLSVRHELPEMVFVPESIANRLNVPPLDRVSAPAGELGAVGVLAPADTDWERVARAVREMAEFTGFTRLSLGEYILIGTRPELPAVVASTRTVFGYGPGSHRYALLRVNAPPTDLDIRNVGRALREGWPPDAEIRLLEQLVDEVRAEPGGEVESWRGVFRKVAKRWQRETSKATSAGALRRRYQRRQDSLDA